MPAVIARVSAEPLEVAAAIKHASHPDLGGIALFIGTVRLSPAVAAKEDRAVTALDYEAHPKLAQAKLDEIAHTAARKWDVQRVFAVHRTGRCELGEPTVVVACGAPHRGDALEACRWIIDTIKVEVPIWKREVYADSGESAWVNTP
jgi:molybdopterin synthase catalytic subunit